MFAALVKGPEEELRRFAIAAETANIGSAPTNEIQLAISDERHARCVCVDSKLIVIDLKSGSGTFVNGRRISAPVVVKDSDVVRIADYSITFHTTSVRRRAVLELFEATDPTERQLLAAIANRDEDSRIVYADWLEERGDAQRASFLRAQEALLELPHDDPGYADRVHRLAAVATTLPLGWRIKVASPCVEHCGAGHARCPMEWGMLAATDRSHVRRCSGCQRQVYYAENVIEARAHVAADDPVAIDVTSARWPGDLDGPYDERTCPRCEIDLGVQFVGERCPCCNVSLVRRRIFG